MRIFVTSSYGYWGGFRPADLFEKTVHDIQIGGGETAMLQIAHNLGKNHEVFVFYDVHRDEYRKQFNIEFLPTSMFTQMACTLDHDVLISWDAPWAFRFADRAKVHVLAFQLNDPQVGVYDWAIDLYMHPSKWHADRTRQLCPEVPKEKQRVDITNGIDFSRYVVKAEKQPYRVIYSSSPDRGLHHLLRIWPEVVSRVPQAELHVFYDITRWLDMDASLQKEGRFTITSDRARLLRQQILSRPRNVFFHGGIGQHRLAEEQRKAAVLAYPCDPVRPTEGYSMTILEGITAGCHVITTDADALPELWSSAPNVTILPLPVDDSIWTNTLIDAMEKPLEIPRYNPVYSWPVKARAWEEELTLCLKRKLQSK